MTDPLTLAIVALISGVVLGVILCVLTLMVLCDLHDQDVDKKLSDMADWYDAEYGKEL